MINTPQPSSYNQHLILPRTVLLLSLIFTGCSNKSSLPIADRLAGEGIIFLSSDNPSLAPNLLVSKLKEHSPEFTTFIEHRGSPSALSVEDGFFSNSKINLFYRDKNESYLVEDAGGTLLILGPSQVDPIIFEGHMIGNITIATPAPSPSSVATAPTEKIKPIVSTVIDNEQKIAEDLTYKVESADDTLAKISERFTGTADNAPLLARINSLAKKTEVSPGDTVVIPKYLLKACGSKCPPSQISRQTPIAENPHKGFP